MAQQPKYDSFPLDVAGPLTQLQRVSILAAEVARLVGIADNSRDEAERLTEQGGEQYRIDGQRQKDKIYTQAARDWSKMARDAARGK